MATRSEAGWQGARPAVPEAADMPPEEADEFAAPGARLPDVAAPPGVEVAWCVPVDAQDASRPAAATAVTASGTAHRPRARAGGGAAPRPPGRCPGLPSEPRGPVRPGEWPGESCASACHLIVAGQEQLGIIKECSPRQ